MMTSLHLARHCLLAEEFDKAIQHITNSDMLVQHNTAAELESLEILLHCYLEKQDYEKVSSLLDAAFTKLRLHPNAFLYSKWQFLKAGIELRSGDAAGALRSLKECGALMKEKNGWLIAYSLFEAICRIESGNLEWLEYRAEAIKKIMLRYNKNGEENQKTRFAVIYKTLRALHKSNYDYVQTLADEQAGLERLAATSYAQSWYIGSFEPVAFDQWLRSKAAEQQKKKKRLVA